MFLINPLIEQLYLTQAIRQEPLKINSSHLSFRPDLLSSLAQAFKTPITSISCDFLYPVDSFSIPLATHLSLIYKTPLFLTLSSRDFIKPGQTALLISVDGFEQAETSIDCLRKQNIIVSDILTLIEGSLEEKILSKTLQIKTHNLWDIKTVKEELIKIIYQNSYSKIHSSDIS